jgi:hypothetical protein
MESQATPQPPTPPAPTPPAPQIKNSLLLIMSVLLIVTVAIAGLFYFQIQKLSKELSKYQIQASPTPTATPDPTANWKTYTSTQFGYSFNYPQSWSLNSENPTEVASVGLDQYLHGVGKPSSGNVWFSVSNVATLEADNRSNQEVGPGATIVLITKYKQKGGETFKLEGGYWENDPKPEEKKQIIDQILSTFKFLDQSNAEGKFCGGFAANLPENQCPNGFHCKYDGNYPDAGGVCTKN